MGLFQLRIVIITLIVVIVVTNEVFFGSLFTFFSKEFEEIFYFICGFIKFKIFVLIFESSNESQLVVFDVLALKQDAQFVNLNHLQSQLFVILSDKMSFEKAEVSLQMIS